MNHLKVALAQISPIWLDKKKTTEKIIDFIDQAGKESCDLIVFGEALLPGYPFWLAHTDGAAFNSKKQKEIHAHYIRESVNIPAGDLDSICHKAKEKNIAIYIGTIERGMDRGGHSLYCSLVYIDKTGEIKSVHRKLQPTYEERLAWSPGDGNGLRTHQLPPFTVGGLNCWENWMPLSRTALYGMGENLHIAVWPGAVRNTETITRFIAEESRSYVISVSSLMKHSDIHSGIPHSDEMLSRCPEVMANGGSCIAAPDGTWLIPPIAHEEGLFTATLDINRVYEERQNFDPTGHYSRPDITKLIVNRDRQKVVEVDESV